MLILLIFILSASRLTPEIPTSFGYQAGIELLNQPFARNPDFHFEWVRIDPWMYNRRQPA
ncbi:MAG: hypothetical protein ACOCW5_03270 [Spirochaetia bacterium]